MNATMTKQEQDVRGKLHLLHEAEQFELPGLPTEFTRAPAPAQFQVLGEPLHEIGPGIWVSGTPEWEMPTHVLCKLVAAGDGLWRLQPEVAPGWVRMTDDIGAKLGIKGLSATTMRRLLQDGYIEHSRPAPHVIFINLESLHEHFRRTRNDCAEPSSFWTSERLEKWRQTCSLDSNLGKIKEQGEDA